MSEEKGSSPLARGLHRGLVGEITDWRIIPARAGFTPVPVRGRTRVPDHPRSRGVYWVDDYLREADLGSSPLARGLPRAADGQELLAGIIPARAGFTRASGRLPPEYRDHPRSRGVYIGASARRRPRVGSSPLARGLPAHGGDLIGAGGIIPARAGFTEHRFIRAQEQQDHPRSRGVYRWFRLRGWGRSGSSPLARGLPA